MVPFFFTALVSYNSGKEYERWIAFFVFSTACLTDMLDGFWARITKTHSSLGQFLDPLADKLLLLSGFLGLLLVPALPYHPPLWVTVMIVFRDLMIVMGLVIIFMLKGTLPVEPDILGKATTACQMATLLTILLAWPIAIPLCYITAALTMASFAVYAIRELGRI